MKLRDKICLWAVFRLFPRRLIYWCAFRAVYHATTKKFQGLPCDPIQVLMRWDEPKDTVYRGKLDCKKTMKISDYPTASQVTAIRHAVDLRNRQLADDTLAQAQAIATHYAHTA